MAVLKLVSPRVYLGEDLNRRDAGDSNKTYWSINALKVREESLVQV